MTLEKQMTVVLQQPTTLTGGRRGAVLGEEVAARTEAVDVGEVGENLDLGGESEAPGEDGGRIQ